MTGRAVALPFEEWIEAARARRRLPWDERVRLAALKKRYRERRDDARALSAEPLALARLVAVDLETTGPDMWRDRIISIGAVAVVERTVRHSDAFERVLRQRSSSAVPNILIHRIGGQEQLAGAEPIPALIDFLAYLGASVACAFRAEFDATVLAREARRKLGLRPHAVFLDLAVLLPALFPGLGNDSLDDWNGHFGLPPIGRHHAVADAYANAQLLLLVLEQAHRAGLRTVGDLVELEKAQRWLGRRR